MMVSTNTAMKKASPRVDNPDPVDVHVGARLRLRRNLVGMSQEQLGKASALTFQQIQKYERGINRMGASRLFQLAQLLRVPVYWFFEDLPPKLSGQLSQTGDNDNRMASIEGTLAHDNQLLQRREALELIRAYYRIADPKQRRRVYELIK